MRLILASSSPQRKQLLEQAGYFFEVRAPSLEAECGVCSGEAPPEMVARLALQKAADVASQLSYIVAGQAPPETEGDAKASASATSPDDIAVLACDTVAECVGHILGKPASAEHARQMLELLSGRPHHVYSGVCVIRLPAAEPHVQVAVTRLRMDVLSSAQIDHYIASGAWEGKAGGFGLQDRPGWLHIEEGSESNVIGLPLELVGEMIARLDSSSQA